MRRQSSEDLESKFEYVGRWHGYRLFTLWPSWRGIFHFLASASASRCSPSYWKSSSKSDDECYPQIFNIDCRYHLVLPQVVCYSHTIHEAFHTWCSKDGGEMVFGRLCTDVRSKCALHRRRLLLVPHHDAKVSCDLAGLGGTVPTTSDTSSLSAFTDVSLVYIWSRTLKAWFKGRVIELPQLPFKKGTKS